jgi:hypothetical protein
MSGHQEFAFVELADRHPRASSCPTEESYSLAYLRGVASGDWAPRRDGQRGKNPSAQVDNRIFAYGRIRALDTATDAVRLMAGVMRGLVFGAADGRRALISHGQATDLAEVI